MYAEKLQNRLNIEIHTDRRGWSKKVKCPFCDGGKTHEKSFTYNWTSGGYKCHRGSCGKSGSVANTKEYKPLKSVYSEAVYNKKLDRFFESRGIDPKLAKEFGIASLNGNPLFKYILDGEAVNAKARVLIKGKKSFYQSEGAMKILYNLDSCEGKEDIIFVEGELDVLAVATVVDRKKYGIVSVDQGAGKWGSDLTGKLECLINSYPYIKDAKRFHLFFDNDQPGLWLQKEFIRRYGSNKCNIIPKGLYGNYNDANAVLMDDLYDEGVKQQKLREMVEGSVPAPMDYVLTVESVTPSMYNYYEHGFPKGITTGFKSLDPYYTCLKGEITVVTGIPGDGKSQNLRQIMLQMSIIHGFKWACFVPENYPFETFLAELIFTYLGKPVRVPEGGDPSERATLAEFTKALEFVNDHFYYIDYPHEKNHEGKVEMPTLQWLNEKFTYLRERFGVNGIVADPYNKISSTQQAFEREDQYLGRWFSEAKGIAKDYDAFFLVAHPTKLAKAKNSDGGTSIPNPGPYNISGGAQWNNAPDNVMSIYRPGRHSGDPNDLRVQIKIWKIRFQQAVGKEGTVDLYFDTKRGRYYEGGPGNRIDPFDGERKAVVEVQFLEDVPDVKKPAKTLEEKLIKIGREVADERDDLVAARPTKEIEIDFDNPPHKDSSLDDFLSEDNNDYLPF